MIVELIFQLLTNGLFDLFLIYLQRGDERK